MKNESYGPRRVMKRAVNKRVASSKLFHGLLLQIYKNTVIYDVRREKQQRLEEVLLQDRLKNI